MTTFIPGSPGIVDLNAMKSNTNPAVTILLSIDTSYIFDAHDSDKEYLANP